jgi:hypothetical protein
VQRTFLYWQHRAGPCRSPCCLHGRTTHGYVPLGYIAVRWPGVGGLNNGVQVPTSLHREYQLRPQRILMARVVRGYAEIAMATLVTRLTTGDGEMDWPGGRLNSEGTLRVPVVVDSFPANTHIVLRLLSVSVLPVTEQQCRLRLLKHAKTRASLSF